MSEKIDNNQADLQSQEQERNELYPIFLKLHNLSVLIVGGGNGGLEKLSFSRQCIDAFIDL